MESEETTFWVLPDHVSCRSLLEGLIRNLLDVSKLAS